MKAWRTTTAVASSAQIVPAVSRETVRGAGGVGIGAIAASGVGKRITRAIAAILLLFACAAPGFAQGTIMPSPVFTGFDSNGDPVGSGKLCTYTAGTSTPATTYSDSALSVPNANPVVLNSAGRATVYLSVGASYKFTLLTAGSDGTCSTGSTVWTADNIGSVPANSGNLDILGTAGEALTAGQAVYLSDGSGGKTAGTWYKSDATNGYSSTTSVVGMAPASISSATAGTIRISGTVTGLSSLTVGQPYYLSSTPGTITLTPPASNRRAMGVAMTTSSLVLQPWQLLTPPVSSGIAQGRLTLTSGLPVTTSDVTGASTVYYTPAVGNLISLYDGTATWTPLTFTELSVALSGLVTGQGYDVFAYNNSGVVALETAEWANATVTTPIASPGVVTWSAHGMTTGQSITFTTTGALPTGISANTPYFITVVDANTFKLSTTLITVGTATFINFTGSTSGTHTGHQPQARATALALQNGVWVKSGTTTRRYLGSFLTTSTSTTEDSVAKRILYNENNKAVRRLVRAETTASWPYTLNAWQQANASTANQVQIFVGLSEDLATFRASVQASNSTGEISMGVALGLDATTSPHPNCFEGVSRSTAATETTLITLLDLVPSVGQHAVVWQERSGATGTTTWYGTAGAALAFLNISGISGFVWA